MRHLGFGCVLRAVTMSHDRHRVSVLRRSGAGNRSSACARRPGLGLCDPNFADRRRETCDTYKVDRKRGAGSPCAFDREGGMSSVRAEGRCATARDLDADSATAFLAELDVLI